jgi:hypothetical protein
MSPERERGNNFKIDSTPKASRTDYITLLKPF